MTSGTHGGVRPLLGPAVLALTVLPAVRACRQVRQRDVDTTPEVLAPALAGPLTVLVHHAARPRRAHR